MQLPSITPLQYLVLTAVMNETQAGSVIRQRLERYGAKKSLAAFYQLMARLEQAGLIHGRYVVKEEGDLTYRERLYSIADEGRAAVEQARAFFAEGR